MIKYNLKDINDWNFDGSNVAKVYRNGAVVYYKLSGESPTPEYQVCFAVVDDITQYSEREFEDVYDKATEKWYKLNNLGEYEKYGVYASGRTSCEGSISPTDCVTTYKGKLTIDEGYEYEWDDSSWANLGEISGDSRLPQGYTEVEYIENTASVSNTDSYNRLAVTFADSIPLSVSDYTFKVVFEMTDLSNTYNNLFGNSYVFMQSLGSNYKRMSAIFPNYRSDSLTNSVLENIKYEAKLYLNEGDTYPKLDITNVSQGTTVTTNLTSSVSIQINSEKLGLFNFYHNNDSGALTAKAKIYEVIVTDGEGNELCHSVPCTRDSDGKVGFYNLVRDEFDYDASGQLTLIAGPNSGSKEYPKYYEEKDEPLNNLTFNTMAEAEAYAKNNCVYDGLKATINGDRYKFVTDEGWVENGGGLPDVPFVLNYNAKQYNSSTKTLLKTEGQLANVNAVITAKTPTLHDEYLTITLGTRATISGYQNYFNRDNNNPNLTIISKQRTDGNNCHMFANRDSNYNWMYRCYSNRLVLHGSSEQGSLTVTAQPVIESVRVNSNRLLTYNNYTDNTSSTQSNFNYGGTNSGNFALFAGYATSAGEWFVGDFYWIYMCQGTLTDDQVQQVIDYNENL